MTDEKARRLEKIAKLTELQTEHIAKLHEITSEIQKLSRGERTAGHDAAELIAYFCDRWKQAMWNPDKAKYDFPREQGTNFRKIINTIGLDEAKARVDRYIEDTDPFLFRMAHSAGMFVTGHNRYLTTTASRVERPLGCQHNPACGSDSEHTKRSRQDLFQSTLPETSRP